jgi:hypothetical protein
MDDDAELVAILGKLLSKAIERRLAAPDAVRVPAVAAE